MVISRSLPSRRRRFRRHLISPSVHSTSLTNTAPVFVLSDETVGHTREKLIIPESIEIFDDKFQGRCTEYYKSDEMGIPPRVRFLRGHNVLVDGQLHDERGVAPAQTLSSAQRPSGATAPRSSTT